MCADKNTSENSHLFSWQKQYAKALPNGDLEWRPETFEYHPGDSIRYIDFENGDDSADGLTKDSPWKHHPWDENAEGNAASCCGIHTYVFKRGTVYRGKLIGRKEGEKGNPVRLTSDPDWGKGEACLYGSVKAGEWKKGADHPDIPEPEKVWYTDLDFSPRSVWLISSENEITRIPLARTPNWKVSNPDDVKSEWWVFDNPGKPFDNFIETPEGRKYNCAYDTVHIKDKPAEYFKDAYIWPEFGWVMSTPYPARVTAVDVENHAVGFPGWTGGPSGGGRFVQGMRYSLEDKPHYLDDPDGEFWFDKKDEGGRLYLRMPGDADPNEAHLELGKRQWIIDGEEYGNIDISGLTFRFTQHCWNLDAVAFGPDFSTNRDVNGCAISVWGSAQSVRIANCTFQHVFMPIRIEAVETDDVIRSVLIEDNIMEYTDDGAVSVSIGNVWGDTEICGAVDDARLYRNRLSHIGMRSARYGQGHAIRLSCVRTVEIAGNILYRCWGSGIMVFGGKTSSLWGDVPFARVLIHQNRVYESMLNANDYGGIETWQGGPQYVFNNLSYNAQGLQYWGHWREGKSAGFGHAYYLDGGYKNYHFNNIAWGKGSDEKEITANCSAFQEIHSYQNSFFNNTAYRYVVGSRRQAPHAGRNKFLGNIWQDMGRRVFRHSDPARTEAAANAHDAGKQKSQFATETNAYLNNVFYKIAEVGCFEPSGRWHKTAEDFSKALEKAGSIRSELGVMSETAPLSDPANGDFRPVKGSAADGKGMKVFIPWALSGVVGEWGFFRAGDDHTRIIDEHWYMTDYVVDRRTYPDKPMYPLTAVNVSAEDYVISPTEDWVESALSFNGKDQYAVLEHDRMMEPHIFTGSRLPRGHAVRKEFTISGEDLRNPQVYTSNFLIEVYLKAENSDCIIAEKFGETGYSLSIDKDGKPVFTAGEKSVTGSSSLNESTWHHIVAECNRSSQKLVLYVDGKKDAEGDGPDSSVNLANESDLFVAGSPGGHCLKGEIDFMRIALGALADADTTIEELYEWEFNGPQLRDFTGKSRGDKPTAGALQLSE